MSFVKKIEESKERQINLTNQRNRQKLTELTSQIRKELNDVTEEIYWNEDSTIMTLKDKEGYELKFSTGQSNQLVLECRPNGGPSWFDVVPVSVIGSNHQRRLATLNDIALMPIAAPHGVK